jgi:hypothetical protein
MQDLYRLIQQIILSKYSTVLNQLDESLKTGKEKELLRGLIDGSYQDDRLASKVLYQSSATDFRLHKLKSRLEEKLLHFLLFANEADTEENTSHSPLGMERRLHQAKMLLSLKEYKISKRLLTRLLKESQEYEHTSLTVTCLTLLLDLYADQGDQAGFSQLQKEHAHYQQIYACEQEAKLLYQQASLIWTRMTPKDISEEYLDEIQRKLRKLWDQTTSFVGFDYYYRFSSLQLISAQEYLQVYSLTRLAVLLSEKSTAFQKRFDSQYNLCLALEACRRIGHTSVGLTLAQAPEAFFLPGTEAWFTFQENHLLLYLHAAQYPQAHQICKDTVQHPAFHLTSAPQQERWKLYAAYLQLLGFDAPPLFLFKVSGIKDQFPLLSKDKQGYLVAILVLEYIYAIRYNLRDELLKKADAYKKLNERHLSKETSPREKLFFQWMLLTIRHHFHAETITVKSQSTFRLLKTSLLSGNCVCSSVEIIPYSTLGASILSLLRESKSRLSVNASRLETHEATNSLPIKGVLREA